MSDITIYHNPRCSKSRQTLALLEERGADVGIIEYLNEPPTAGAIRELHAKLGGAVWGLVRKKEADYAESGLVDDSTDEEVYAAIETFPKLLERPIVVRGNRAVIGRPPENVDDLF